MLKSIDEGENKVVMKNGEKWVYKCMDKHVHKKGWKETTVGSGSARAVEDQDIDMMSALMKKSGWEHTLGTITTKQEKTLEDKGVIPDGQIEKLKNATNVWAHNLNVSCNKTGHLFHNCLVHHIQ